MDPGNGKRGRDEKEDQNQDVNRGAEKKLKLQATTTLAEAAEAAGDDRDDFVALVESLGARKRKVQDLLAEGKLWSGLKEDVSLDQAKKRTLEAFFDYCKREISSQSVSPVTPVVVPNVDVSYDGYPLDNSADSPVMLPNTTTTNFFPDNEVLNQAYDLVNGASVKFPDFSTLERTVSVDPQKSTAVFPGTVNVENEVDFRLPHSNPLLEGNQHPLKLMRDDLLAVKKFHLALLIGSSGCGKTTTAFLVAQERFTLFMEIRARGDNMRVLMPYHIRETQFSRQRNSSKPTYDDIKRRALREIVARAILLAIAFQRTDGKLTPYQWLLYSLSKDFRSLVTTLKGGLKSDDDATRILEAVSKLVGKSVAVVIDEAHLLCDKPDYELPAKGEGEGHKINALSALICGLLDSGAPNWIHSLLLLGTQMSLEKGARVASSVFKSHDRTPVVAVCTFPFLEAWEKNESDSPNPFSVEQSLLKCFEQDFIRGEENLFREICLRFQGRPRVVADFVAKCLNTSDPQFDLAKTFQLYDSPGIKDEIVRLRNQPNPKLDASHLFELWYRSLIGDRTFPLGEYGTLAFTESLVRDGCETFGQTGVMLLQGGKEISFIHRIDEPILVEGIIAYLMEETPSKSPFQRLYQHMSNNVVATTNATVRGTYLDALVLLRVLTLSAKTSLSLGDFFHSDDVPHKDATFSVKRIVGGIGMLNTWASIIVENPDLELMPGIKARHVAVLPETNAGADGVFAAFNGDGSIVVFISVVCAWYEDGVTAEKVRDQLSKSDLSNQFQSAQTRGVLQQRKVELSSLCGQKTVRNLRVSVELPHRNGELPQQMDLAVFIIDKRNVQNVLGLVPRKITREKPVAKKAKPSNDDGSGHQTSKTCAHRCKNKQNCSHKCCKK